MKSWQILKQKLFYRLIRLQTIRKYPKQDQLKDGLDLQIFINHIWLEYLIKCPQNLLYRERCLEVVIIEDTLGMFKEFISSQTVRKNLLSSR